MEKQELISIIVPVYNVENYLSKCIESLLSQSYENIEVILVDDGSTDSSGEICDRFALKDKRIKVIHQENAGVSASRNKALKFANGQWLMFVDSDDYVEKDFCEAPLRYATENSCEIVCFNYKAVSDSEVINAGNNNECNCLLDRTKAMIMHAKYELSDYVWDKLYRAAVWKGLVFPEASCCEDMGILFKCFERTANVGIIPDCLYNYYQRDNSTVHSISTRRTLDTFRMYKERFDFYDNWDSTVVDYQHKELVKLALFCCIALKNEKDHEDFKTALSVIKKFHDIPDVSIKGKLRLLFFRYFIR
jgi:glycosyltransferase involved in cell wall biosynthesis